MEKTVVAIDDDIDDLDMMRSVLNKVDPHIHYIPFLNPMEAIKQLGDEDFRLPDCIFIDINMPLMSGYECLLELRRHNRYEDVQIIMFSTYISKIDSDSLMKVGATFAYNKPFSVAGYVEILKNLTLFKVD